MSHDMAVVVCAAALPDLLKKLPGRISRRRPPDPMR
jgi:hypothetical protein